MAGVRMDRRTRILNFALSIVGRTHIIGFSSTSPSLVRRRRLLLLLFAGHIVVLGGICRIAIGGTRIGVVVVDIARVAVEVLLPRRGAGLGVIGRVVGWIRVFLPRRVCVLIAASGWRREVVAGRILLVLLSGVSCIRTRGQIA